MDFDENAFYQQLTKQAINYKLPEFTTSFLLARNVEMEFSDLHSDMVASTMNSISHDSTSSGWRGWFLCFPLHSTTTSSQQASHVQVKRTASGMKISIPGVQMIGYYTKVLPKFPLDQNQFL